MQQTEPVDHETREIDEVIQRLQDRFPDQNVERIREAVTDAHRDFEGRPIRDFVPVFVERAAPRVLDHHTTRLTPRCSDPGRFQRRCGHGSQALPKFTVARVTTSPTCIEASSGLRLPRHSWLG